MLHDEHAARVVEQIDCDVKPLRVPSGGAVTFRQSSGCSMPPRV
jgi:hypothetical protein